MTLRCSDSQSVDDSKPLGIESTGDCGVGLMVNHLTIPTLVHRPFSRYIGPMLRSLLALLFCLFAALGVQAAVPVEAVAQDEICCSEPSDSGEDCCALSHCACCARTMATAGSEPTVALESLALADLTPWTTIDGRRARELLRAPPLPPPIG